MKKCLLQARSIDLKSSVFLHRGDCECSTTFTETCRGIYYYVLVPSTKSGKYMTALAYMYKQGLYNIVLPACFPQLHQHYALKKFLLVGTGYRILCHHIMNNFLNFAITFNRRTLAEISTLFQLEKQEGITITSCNSLVGSLLSHSYSCRSMSGMPYCP